MDKIICVYMLQSPTGKVYVGSTINYQQRMVTYMANGCKHQTKLLNSLKKYGFENHKVSILEVCQKENVRQREAFYCVLHDVLNKETGLNLTIPKTDEVLYCHSEETRKKRSESHKGKIISQATKDKYRNTMLKKIENGYINPNLGRVHTKEARESFLKGAKNRKKPEKFSESHRQKLKIASAKSPKSAKIVLNTQTGIFYNSAKEAAAVTNIKRPYFVKRLGGYVKNNTSFIYV